MLGPEFYQQPTLELAEDLLGRLLVHRLDGVTLKGRIVEVEAYHQDDDRAAHSFSGKTKRNAVMFGPAGYLYVYFIYGMHFCMNVVSEQEGIGAAVLIRAVEPVEGMEEMQRRRGDKIKRKDLTNGPARCCKAFGIDRAQDGVSLQGPDFYLEAGESVDPADIVRGPRIGISKSTELPWRFYIKDNVWVSRR